MVRKTSALPGGFTTGNKAQNTNKNVLLEMANALTALAAVTAGSFRLDPGHRQALEVDHIGSPRSTVTGSGSGLRPGSSHCFATGDDASVSAGKQYRLGIQDGPDPHRR